MVGIAALLAIAFATLDLRAAEVQRPSFATGQVWSVKSAAPSIQVVIARVEPWGDKVAVHLSIRGVPIPDGMQGAGNLIEVKHMPFDQAALAASVDRLLATGEPIDTQVDEGITHWRKQQGGIFTLSVAEAIAVLFETLRAPARPT